MIRKLIETRQYIVFPAEVPRPPKGSLEDMKKELARLRNERMQKESPTVVDIVEPPRQKWFGIF